MRPSLWRTLLLAMLLGLGGPGCINVQPSADTCESPSPEGDAPTGLGYHADVASIVANRCARCHVEGGLGPFPLRSYADVYGAREAVRDAVVSRRMPPWPPAPCCASYQHDLSLTDEEYVTLVGWIDQGAPEGDPSDTPPVPPRRGLERVDVQVTMPEPYTPKAPEGSGDDTRCFLLDWPETRTRYVTGLDILPGVAPQVHHTIVLTASPKDAKVLEKRDREDPGPGWSCPGGVVSAYNGYLGGGFFEAQHFPAGIGHKMEPGDKLILTVHYSEPPFGGYQPDQTTVLVRHQEAPTVPIILLSAYDPSWLLGTMRIPSGAAEATHSYATDPPSDFNGGKPFTLYGVNLHMHERGNRGQVTLLRGNGERECLLQIDRWDHAWQGDYVFETPKTLGKDDRLLVSCTWDNSEANQQVVGGVPQKPRTLNWSEEEEMCIAFVTATQKQ